MDKILAGTETEEITEPAGENEQEDAAPAPDTTGEGENEQEDAAPAPAVQTPEENAAFAAARRRAQHNAAIRTQAEKDALVQRIYQGQVNPYTGRPITSEKDLNEYEQQYQADQLRQSGIDANVLNRMIENNPVVQQARQMTARMQQEEGQRAMQQQIDEISKIDPSVTDFNSLVSHPNFQQFNARVMQGYSMVDAFKLANYDQITAKKAAAAKQAALNSVNGKNHLNPTKGAGSGEDIVVPEETMAMYRMAFKGWTNQQIIDDYKKRMNQ